MADGRLPGDARAVGTRGNRRLQRTVRRHHRGRHADSGHWDPDPDSDDPLLRCPRIMHPHRFDELALRMLLDLRIEAVLAALMDEEPIAAQSMFYFKPPGSRDRRCTRTTTTCACARIPASRRGRRWTARSPEKRRPVRLPGHAHDGGGVSGGGRSGAELHHPLRTAPPAGCRRYRSSWTRATCCSSAAASCTARGRTPPTTSGGAASSAIYLPASSHELSRHYRPTLRFDGREYDFADASGGGPCGTAFPDGLVPGQWEVVRRLGLRPAADGRRPGA